MVCIALGWRFAAFTLPFLSPFALPAQVGWSPTPTTGGPPGLFGHAAAQDLLRERLVVFGGFTVPPIAQARTWEFDGADWHDATPPSSPPARGGHAMVYDLARGCVVLFGGTSAAMATNALDDTWEWNGTAWQSCAPLHRPARRYEHAMAYDLVSGRTLLHGGRTNAAARHADTWAWNGSDWTQQAATGPSARCRHAMSHDLNRGRTVLFGGEDPQRRGDTWEWNGVSWLPMATSGPSPRSGHCLAFDLQRAVTVLHGGDQGGSETWEWDGTGWSLSLARSNPRTDAVMAFDATAGRTTLFGGLGSGSGSLLPTALTGVLTLGPSLPGSFTAHGQGCQGSMGTPALLPGNPAGSPTIGQTSCLCVGPVPGRTFFVFGWSATQDGTTPLPLDLTPLGMAGCSLAVSRDAVASAGAVDGWASLPLAIPFAPHLVNDVFHVQAFALDAAANAVGFTTSNALAATIGRL